MISFLFWNICGTFSEKVRQPDGKYKTSTRPLQRGDARYLRLRRLISVLVFRRKIDVIVIAESPFEGQLNLAGFKEAKTSRLANRSTKLRLEVYYRDTVDVSHTNIVERTIFHELTVKATGYKILLTSTHLDSKLYLSQKTREQKFREFADDIRNEEASLKHQNTVVVGDLNCDPYESAMMDGYQLNAVPSKWVAEQKVRVVSRDELPYFYNPMWAHLSDITGRLPGTYYRQTNDVDCRIWHIVDQVLIRPNLLPYWDDINLQVVSHTGKTSLKNDDLTPNRVRFSDHFPILFSLNV